MKNQIAVLIILIFTTKIYAQDIIIKNVNLITMTTDRLIINQSLLIRNGKINQIGDFSKLSKNNQTTIINGKGKYVMPGLADMHVHLPEEDKIEKLLLSNIAAGVTQIRVMNSVVPQKQVKENLTKITELLTPTLHYSYLIKSNQNFTELQSDSLMIQLIK